MIQSFIVLGTDTGVGKTVITSFFLRYFLEKGINAVSQKWIQTGVQSHQSDIDFHDQFSGFNGNNSKDRCPYVFQFPSSPHLAAQRESILINASVIKSSYNRLCNQYSMIIVEGTGGIMVPYSSTGLVSDWVTEWNIPVVLVIGNQLGCINHTLLSLDYLKNSQITLKGLIFSCPHQTNLDILDDNVSIISSKSDVPVLANIPHGDDMDSLYTLFKNQMDHG